MRLENKVALVTGGNSGIGRAIAEEFAKQGAKVIVFGRNQETLDETLAALGDGHLAVRGDVAKLGDLERLYSEIESTYGHLDVLVTNAGIAIPVAAADIDEETFDRIFSINVKGLFFTVQKALPLLREGASVILNASSVTYRGMQGMTVYGASKAAVRYFARGLSAELLAQGLRFNVLSPGPIDTPIFDHPGQTKEQREAVDHQITQMVPMGRFGRPEEMAKVALFLASDDSSYLTGTDILADGGFATV